MKRKIMFLIYSLCGGGAQRVLVDAANALCEDSDLDITVRALFDDATYSKSFDERVHYRAAFDIKFKPVRRLVSGFVQYLMPPSLTYRLLFRGEYDFEVAYMEAFPTKILAASSNVTAKKYAWVHIDMCKYKEQDKLFVSNESQRKCYERFDKICCVSEDVRKSFVEKFGQEYHAEVIYNILNENKIYEMKGQYCGDIPKDKFLIVSVGSLIRRKGFDRLVRICSKLKHEGFEINTIVIGEGEQLQRLEKQIAKENLTDEFRLMGYKYNPYPYIAAADLYVCPSHTEGFSTAVSEAVLLGLPIVATDCAGMHEILGQSEYGIVTGNDEEKLYIAIKQMLENPELRAQYSQKAKQRAKEISMNSRIGAYKKLFYHT